MLFVPNLQGRSPVAGRFALALALIATLGAAGCSNKPKVVVDPEIEEAVRVRKQNFSEMGTIAKNINDALKAGTKLVADPTVGSYVQQLGNYARDQKFWFKEGTGPASGADTHAKAEIWTQQDDFAKKIEALIESTGQLSTTFTGGDEVAFESQWKEVGKTCESCHDSYRTPDEDKS